MLGISCKDNNFEIKIYRSDRVLNYSLIFYVFIFIYFNSFDFIVEKFIGFHNNKIKKICKTAC